MNKGYEQKFMNKKKITMYLTNKELLSLIWK